MFTSKIFILGEVIHCYLSVSPFYVDFGLAESLAHTYPKINMVPPSGERYLLVDDKFLKPILDYIDLNNMWFQQDGAKCHSTLDLPHENFVGNVHWPPG